jgi:DNA replication and repair protein RecF
VRLLRLQIEQFRAFDRVELSLDPGLNLFTGGNGAGKTSVLEAVHLLAYGRSFRGAVRDGLIRRGQPNLRVFAEVEDEHGLSHRLGLERGLREGQGRVDGQTVAALSDLYRQIAVVCFEPGSHELIGGGSEHRRRFLDWTLFHVEPDFLPAWRRTQRALRQRNALLKQAGSPDLAALDAWETELAEAGESLTRQREAWLDRFMPHLRVTAGRLLPEVGEATLRFQRGWPASEESLASALRQARARDTVLGHTTVGPHRADWSLAYPALPGRETFSRGQEKLSALACVLAQAEAFAAARGAWPILCLDDLASELDRAHQSLVLDWLDGTPAQWLLTGTEEMPALKHRAGARFHVEQDIERRGQVARLL